MRSARIRKQVHSLTPEDLDGSPVWEFALDEEGKAGQDEATVRPYKTTCTLDPSAGMFVVRARFVLADGTLQVGYITPPVQSETGPDVLQPTIVTGKGQVSFWCGMLDPEPDELAVSYALLGKSSASQVFPLRFTSDVDLLSVPVTGELPGFLAIDDFETMSTKVVK